MENQYLQDSPEHIFALQLDTETTLSNLYKSPLPKYESDIPSMNTLLKDYNSNFVKTEDVLKSNKLDFRESLFSDDDNVRQKAQDFLQNRTLESTEYKYQSNFPNMYTPEKGFDKFLNEKFGYNPNVSLAENEDFYSQLDRQDHNIFYRGGRDALKFISKVVPLTGIKLAEAGNFIGRGAFELGQELGESIEDWTNPNNKRTNYFWEDVTNNAFAKGLKSATEKLNDSELLNVYKSLDYDNKGIISKAMSSQFWLNSGADGLAFMLSAIVPGATLSKLGLLSETSIALGSRMVNIGGKAIDLGKFANAAVKLTTGSETLGELGVWGMNTVVESMQEAAGSYNVVYQNTYDQLKANNPDMPSDEMDKQAKEVASDQAAKLFGYNMAILALSNAWENRMLFKTLKKGRNLPNTNGLNLAENSFKVQEKIYKNWFKKAIDFSPGAVADNRLKYYGLKLAEGTLKEGLYEENFQLAAQRIVENRYGRTEVGGKKNAYDTDNNMLTLAGKQIRNTFTGDDMEAQESIFLGSVLGGGMSVITSKLGRYTDPNSTPDNLKKIRGERKAFIANRDYTKARINNAADAMFDLDIYEKDENGNDIIENNKKKVNENVVAAKTKALQSFLGKTSTIDLFNDEDKEYYRNHLIADYMRAVRTANLHEQALNRFTAFGEKNPELVKMFGYDPTSNSEQIAEVTKKAKQFDKLYTDVFDKNITKQYHKRLEGMSMHQVDEINNARKHMAYQYGIDSIASDYKFAANWKALDGYNTKMNDLFNKHLDSFVNAILDPTKQSAVIKNQEYIDSIEAIKQGLVDVSEYLSLYAQREKIIQQLSDPLNSNISTIKKDLQNRKNDIDSQLAGYEKNSSFIKANQLDLDALSKSLKELSDQVYDEYKNNPTNILKEYQAYLDKRNDDTIVMPVKRFFEKKVEGKIQKSQSELQSALDMVDVISILKAKQLDLQHSNNVNNAISEALLDKDKGLALYFDLMDEFNKRATPAQPVAPTAPSIANNKQPNKIPTVLNTAVNEVNNDIGTGTLVAKAGVRDLLLSGGISEAEADALIKKGMSFLNQSISIDYPNTVDEILLNVEPDAIKKEEYIRLLGVFEIDEDNLTDDEKLLSMNERMTVNMLITDLIERHENYVYGKTPESDDKVVESVDDVEYEQFINNGIVSEDRLNSIAEKMKNSEELSPRETEIFTDKTDEILKKKVEPEQKEPEVLDNSMIPVLIDGIVYNSYQTNPPINAITGDIIDNDVLIAKIMNERQVRLDLATQLVEKWTDNPDKSLLQIERLENPNVVENNIDNHINDGKQSGKVINFVTVANRETKEGKVQKDNELISDTVRRRNFLKNSHLFKDSHKLRLSVTNNGFIVATVVNENNQVAKFDINGNVDSKGGDVTFLIDTNVYEDKVVQNPRQVAFGKKAPMGMDVKAFETSASLNGFNPGFLENLKLFIANNPNTLVDINSVTQGPIYRSGFTENNTIEKGEVTRRSITQIVKEDEPVTYSLKVNDDNGRLILSIKKNKNDLAMEYQVFPGNLNEIKPLTFTVNGIEVTDSIESLLRKGYLGQLDSIYKPFLSFVLHPSIRIVDNRDGTILLFNPEKQKIPNDVFTYLDQVSKGEHLTEEQLNIIVGETLNNPVIYSRSLVNSDKVIPGNIINSNDTTKNYTFKEFIENNTKSTILLLEEDGVQKYTRINQRLLVSLPLPATAVQNTIPKTEVNVVPTTTAVTNDALKDVEAKKADIEKRRQAEFDRATRQDGGEGLKENAAMSKRANEALDEWIKLKKKFTNDNDLIEAVMKSDKFADISEFVNNDLFGQDAADGNYDKIRKHYTSQTDEINNKFDAELSALATNTVEVKPKTKRKLNDNC